MGKRELVLRTLCCTIRLTRSRAAVWGVQEEDRLVCGQADMTIVLDIRPEVQAARRIGI